MSKAKSNLQLVTPDFSPDFSRLVPHTGQTVKRDPTQDDPHASILIPSSDLTTLLADPDLRRRYREGRYVQGKNVSLRVAAWPTPLSVTTSAIVTRCEPTLGAGVVAALALHIGIRHISSWESTSQLKEVQESFSHDSPSYSAVTVHCVKHLLDKLQPLPMGGRPYSVVISEALSDELLALSGATGMGCGFLASYCCMVTLVEQPRKYVNKHLKAEMEGRVNELRKWLRWKARTIEAAIEEFDAPDAPG